ncbi:MAG TPA: succinate--CoA ligase subunit alpha [Nitrososphaerales archaeon]|nr:succinate--CoA ligase subunit alpha [Nitrososphaerales archaeon]
MTILVDKSTKLVVQGITGREGSSHAQAMLKYGTKILAGVTPGKAGETVNGIPVYNTVKKAIQAHPEINASIIFVPAAYNADAVYEAVDSDLKLVVDISEHVPVHDSLRFINYCRNKGVTVIGPNCPGLISPGEAKVGIMPGHIFSKGDVGIVSRSGTLTYEIAWVLTKAGLGQSTAVGIGGDPIIGRDTVEVVEMLEADPGTRAIVVIGEIGGDAEERLARKVRAKGLKKPIVSFIAGRQAPPGKRMGHAGAIVSMGSGTAAGKIQALEDVGIPVAELPSQIPALIHNASGRLAPQRG